MSNSLSANVMLYFLNILLIVTLLTHPFLPFMTPSAAAAPQAFRFPTIGDLLNFTIDVRHDFRESIALAGDEVSQAQEELHDHLNSLIKTLSETYEKNLNVTIESIDESIRKNLLEFEKMMLDLNQALQEDIRLISDTAQKLVKDTSRELQDITIQLERSLSNVIIVGGETTAYVIDRATYSTILTSSFILLALGILLFIWLLFIQGLPAGCLTRLMVLTFMATYMALLGSFLLVEDVRDYALTYTGPSLGERLDTVVNEPRVLEVRPDKIVLGETKELEIWGSLLLPQSIKPIVKIGGEEVEIKDASNSLIVIDVYNLNISEGRKNLVLLYEGLVEEEEEPNQIVQVLTAFCLAYQEQEEPNQVIVSLCPANQEEEKPEEEPEPHEVVEVVQLQRPTLTPTRTPTPTRTSTPTPTPTRTPTRTPLPERGRYTMTVKTACGKNFGTDDSVKISVFGESGSIKNFNVDIKEPYDDRENCQLDKHATYSWIYLGKIKYIELTLYGDDDWVMEYMTIKDENSGKTTFFECADGWKAIGDDAPSHTILIEPNGDCAYR